MYVSNLALVSLLAAFSKVLQLLYVVCMWYVMDDAIVFTMIKVIFMDERHKVDC